jgi:iron complex outermembrane receptor protein
LRRRSQPWPAALVVLLLCPPRSLAEPPVPPVPPADPAVTPPAAQQFQFRIPAQRADRALTAFARQAGITLVFCFESARRKQASALVGRYTLDEALALLLRGTGMRGSVESGPRPLVRVVDPATSSSTCEEQLMKTTSRTRLWGAVAAIIAGAPGAPAQAQTAQEAAAAEPLDEIIVSANRRDERLLDVPSAITALSGESLAELGVSDISGLTSRVPNFTMGSPAGEGTTPSLSIRGVGLNTFSDNLEGAVAVYVDDVYMATVAGQAAKFFDMKRVEVLRGPQGTLYGRNATAGLVHFVTNPPTETVEGYGELTLGSFSQRRFEGALGGPLGDNVRGRVSMLYDRDDGYMRERISGRNVASKDILAGRAQLVTDLGETASLHFRANVSRIRNVSVLENHRGLLDPATFTPCSVARVNARECVDAFGYRDPNSDPFAANFHGADNIPLDVDTIGGSVTARFALGAWDVTSITAYEDLKKRHIEAGVVVPFGLATAAGLAAFENTKFRLDLDAKQLTQELRAGRQLGDVYLMVGGFYMDDEKTGAVELPASFRNPLAVSQDPYLNRFGQQLDTWAAFVHAEWKLTPTFDLRAGARYSSEDSESSVDVNTGGFFGAILGAPDVRENRSFSDEFVSWDVTASWKPADDLLVYAKVANGYKSGGTNAGGIISSRPQVEPFASENLKMYEVGVKGAWADQRLRASAAAFYYDYRDLQLFTQSLVGGIPVDRVENAANAEISGLELELTADVASWLDVQLGGAYLDTKTKDFISVVGVTPGGQPIVEDRSGKRLVFAPEFSVNGSVRAHGSVGGGEAAAVLAFNHVSEYFFDIGNGPLDAAGDVALLNAHVSWAPAGARWSIAASAQNLTDKVYYTEGYNLLGAQYRFVGRPRTWGASFRIRM